MSGSTRSRVLVLDEADRMLDMGFIRDVRKIVALCRRERQIAAVLGHHAPAHRQGFARAPFSIIPRVDIAPAKVAVERIDQRVFFVGTRKSGRCSSLLADQAMDRVLVFTRTKRGADRVCRNLMQAGLGAGTPRQQGAERARARARCFRSGRVRILVATDIAARGIDVPNISHVVDYELPMSRRAMCSHRPRRALEPGAAFLSATPASGLIFKRSSA